MKRDVWRRTSAMVVGSKSLSETNFRHSRTSGWWDISPTTCMTPLISFVRPPSGHMRVAAASAIGASGSRLATMASGSGSSKPRRSMLWFIRFSGISIRSSAPGSTRGSHLWYLSLILSAVRRPSWVIPKAFAMVDSF
ncbi:MAG TPA: hypothetical protein EYP72_00700 [Rhodospirillales bacterium]|nr:hypothetical protein [Rhodospirillales bacterium]